MAIQQAIFVAFGMPSYPLIDGLTIDSHRQGCLGLGLANGVDQEDGADAEGFLVVAIDAMKTFSAAFFKT